MSSDKSKTTVLSFDRNPPKPKTPTIEDIPQVASTDKVMYNPKYGDTTPSVTGVDLSKRGNRIDELYISTVHDIIKNGSSLHRLAPYAIANGVKLNNELEVIEGDWFGLHLKRHYLSGHLPMLTCWNDLESLDDKDTEYYLKVLKAEYPSGISLPFLKYLPRNLRVLVRSAELNPETKRNLLLNISVSFITELVKKVKFTSLNPAIVIHNKTLMTDELLGGMDLHLLDKYPIDYLDDNIYLLELATGKYSPTKFLVDLNNALSKVPTVDSIRVDDIFGSDMLFIKKAKKTTGCTGKVPKAGDYASVSPVSPVDAFSRLPAIEEVLVEVERINSLNSILASMMDGASQTDYDDIQSSPYITEHEGLPSSAVKSTNPILGDHLNRDLAKCHRYLLGRSIPRASVLRFIADLLDNNEFRYEVYADVSTNRNESSGVVSPVEYEKYIVRRGRSNSEQISVRPMLSPILDNILNVMTYSSYQEAGSRSAWDHQFAVYVKTEENLERILQAMESLRVIQRDMRDVGELGALSPSHSATSLMDEYRNIRSYIRSKVLGNVESLLKGGAPDLEYNYWTLDLGDI